MNMMLDLENLTDWRDLPLSNPKGKLKVGTLFSGIGAIEHALERLDINHEIVFAGDIDKFVKQSYEANYSGKLQNWHNDVTEFNAEPFLNQIDLLVGGSPCQAFSMVGKRLGLEDVRGTLLSLIHI